MKYLYWRGDSLWCRFPLPGRPPMYPLGIKRLSGSITETKKCERLGELKLSEFRVNAVTGELVAKRGKEYNPTFRKLARRYWCNHLRYTKTGFNEFYHLKVSYLHFGKKLAKEISRDDIENWRQNQITAGDSINTVNNRYTYLKSVYLWANSESNKQKRLDYNPCLGLKKIPGGNIRTFVLTKEQFEPNYILLRDGCPQVPANPKFALFYLALWETMRRPEEVSQYTWELITELLIDGAKVRCFQVPPTISKTKDYDIVIISDRLYFEMLQTTPRTGLVFKNARGTRWRDWAEHKAKLVKVYGERAGWIRDCRRGAITDKVEVEGFDPMHVKMQSGHKTNSMFERYRIGKIKNVLKMYERYTENEGKSGK